MGTTELLIYVLFIVGFLLFNFLAQQLGRRARQQQERAQQQESAPVPVEYELLQDAWGRTPQAELPEAAPVVTAPSRAARRVEAIAAAPAPQRRSATSLLRSRQGLRDAIVIMTVLGPCRALDPHDRG